MAEINGAKYFGSVNAIVAENKNPFVEEI